MAELSSYLAGEGGIMGILATKRPEMMPITSLDIAKLRCFTKLYLVEDNLPFLLHSQ